MDYRIIDSDGHVCEPGDLWVQYLGPDLRDRAPKVVVDPSDGLERFQVEGRMIGGPTGVRATGSLGLPLDEVMTYGDGRQGGFDPHERIKDLDLDGIDAVALFPSLGLLTGGIKDPELAVAVCRAYNRWLVDFCEPYPDRLFGVAMLPMQSVEGAIDEVRFAREMLGLRAAFLRPNPYNDVLLSDPAYDPLWAVAQDLDIAICLHEGTGGGGAPGAGTDRVGTGFGAHHVASHTLEMMLASLNIIFNGVCERFPRLRFGFMEAGGGWMASWLDRMDRHYDNEVMGPDAHLSLRPSEYFARQCWISFEPSETSIGAMTELLGPNKILWATDYPHVDGWFPGAPEMITANLPEHKHREVLAQGAIEFYKIGE